MTTDADRLCALLISDQEIEQSVQNTLGTFPVFTGENEVGSSQIAESVKQALNTYNIHRPHELNSVVAGRGTTSRFYRLTGFPRTGEPDALLEGSWDTEFSTIKDVIYPVPSRADLPSFELTDGVDNAPTELLRFSQYDVFERSVEIEGITGIALNESWLVFQGDIVPNDSSNFLIEYTNRHKFADVGCTGGHEHTTVPQNHKSALVYLATALVAIAAAWRAEKALDVPSGAEFVTMRDKARGFQRISDHYRMLYEREIGVETTPAAVSLVDVDVSNVFTVTQRQGNVTARGLSGQRDTRGRF